MSFVQRASYATYVRYTLDGDDWYLGTDDAVRGGQQYTACLADDVALSDAWIEDIARGASLNLRINARADLQALGIATAYVQLLNEDPTSVLFTVETVCTVTYSDGTTTTFTRGQQLTCTGVARVPGGVVLTLADIEDKRLDKLWPPRLYTADDWPNLLTSDAGRAVPQISGLALKLPGVLVDSAGPYRYVIAAGTVTVLTVYRGRSADVGRVVDPGEYTTGTSGSPWAHTYIEFTAEQRDFDGGLFVITADCQTTGSGVNPADEISTLATAAGITLNGPALSGAQGFATAQSLTVDCDHGRAGQRTIRAILEDLLWVLRATLSRNSLGEYVITCDGTGSSSATFVEEAGDPIEVLSLSRDARPNTVGIRYRPGPRDAGSLQHAHTRSVTGGTLGDDRPRELRYVRSHAVADRCAYYRKIRAEQNQRLRARIYQQTLSIGDVITVYSSAFGLTTGSAFGLSASTWRVREVQSIVGGVEVVCTPYSADLTSYSAGTLPDDANDDYQPDYSATPPAAPSSFRITARATALQGDGTLVSSVTADCIPPTVNWEQIWIAAIHNTTSEIAMAQASAVGGGRWGLVLTGLRPGEVYQLKAYAINAFGVQGVVQGTFNATAIGGGASDTTFTSAGYATLPADVASCTAAQGSARLIAVSWPAVTTSNLREYVLERSINGGGYGEVWRGQARNYVDRDISYATSYQYRVKARDTFGNLSANWATSGSLTPANGTIVGGSSGNDIGSSTVATANRTAKTTFTETYTNPGPGQVTSYNISHTLGSDPLLTVDLGGKTTAIATLSNVNSSTADVTVMGALQSGTTSSEVPNNPHTHSLTGYVEGGTISLRVW